MICILLHTHIDILNLISLKNVTWHLIFRYVNRWTLVRMVISTARDNCIISRDDFIIHCENKCRRIEYGSLGICWQIWTRPNNYGTVYDIRCNKTIINLVRVWYDGLFPSKMYATLGQAIGWHNLSLVDTPSYLTLTRLIIV